MKSRLLFSLLLGVGVLLNLSTLAVAQYRADLQGAVTDESGAVIPGATVTLLNKESGRSDQVTTDNAGLYTFPHLGPGSYQVTVEKEGFQKKVVPQVSIVGEQRQSANVVLSPGAVSQTVTVSGDVAPTIDTETGNITGTITAKQLQTLPSFSRDPYQLAQLAPGVLGDTGRSSGGGTQQLPGNTGPNGSQGTTSIFQTENQVQISANGQRTTANSYQIDGVEVNSLAWGGAAVITPNEESVKDIQIQANPYDAENGRNSGAQVLVVSKSGTNDWHGSFFWKFDRPGLNAYQKWNGPNNAPVTRDTNRFNQFGGSVGGPIVKNRLFFFFSYETLRNASTSTVNNWYETPQFDSTAAANGGIAAKILGFPGVGVSQSGIAPRSCADAGINNPALCQVVNINGQYAGLDVGSPLRLPLGTPDPSYHSPGDFGVGGGLDGIPDVFFVQSLAPNSTVSQQYQGRMDFQATNNDLLTFQMYWVPNNSTFYNGPARAANLWHSNRLNYSAAGIWSHTFNPTTINEARANVTRWYFNEVTSNPQEPWGLPQDNLDTFGGVNAQFFGAPGPGVFYQTTYNFRDTVTKVIGSHSLKIGGDVYLEQDNDSQAWAARPQYTFRNLWDFANDAPYTETGNFNPSTGAPTSVTKYIRSNIYAGFIQDDWKVRPNLTLNLGLRWEYFTPLREKYGQISNPILGPDPTDPLLGVSMKVGGNLYNSSKNNWGPQIGFAWDPYGSGTTVIRGGFGIGYNRMQEAITLNGRSNPPFVTNYNLFDTNVVYAVPANTNQFNGWPSNPNTVTPIGPNGLPTSGAPVSLTQIQPNLPTPMTYRFSLEVQHDFGHNWVLTTGYQGSLAHHYTVQTNLNWYYIPLNPQIQNLTLYYNGANGNYNAALVGLKHRFSSTFEVAANYAWAKSMDQGSNDYFIGTYPFNLASEYGPSDYDVRHNFKMWGTWTPAIGPRQGWANKLLGDWTVSGIMNYHTGFPWTPMYANTGCNVVYANSGYCRLRPAAYFGGAGTDYSTDYLKQPSANFPGGALSYFAVPTWPAVGIPPAPGVGRNSFRGPRFFNVDMTLGKAFGLPKMPILGEQARLFIRADFYNIFNKLNLLPFVPSNNLDNPSTVISYDGVTSNPSFGQAQGAYGGRVIELQARFSF